MKMMKYIGICTLLLAVTLSCVNGQSKPIIEVFIARTDSDETVILSKDNPSEIVVSEEQILEGTQFNHVVLLCNASYPVEWIYEGDGAPRLYTTQLRSFTDFRDTASHIHTNIVVLFQERFNEEQTGTYICRGVNNKDSQTGFHLYFKGEFGFPAVSNRVIQPKETDEVTTLPCAATDPLDSMHLFKVEPVEDSANLTTHESISYDPAIGFSFRLKDFPRPYGTYFCKAGNKQSFWKIELVQPKSKEVQISPDQELVPMDDSSNRTFMCKAKEKILLNLPNTMDFGTIDYFQNNDEEYPFLAVLRLTPDVPLNSMSNYFKINCVTRKSRRILHTWEYSNIGKDELTITYDKEQKRVLCCSKSGLTPVHELAKCETHTDCTIKQHCFDSGRCEYNFPPKFVDSPRGCTAVEFVNDFPTHAMKCYVGKTSKTLHITHTVTNDDIIISDGNVPETDKILKLIPLTEKKDGVVHVQCIGNMFYFSTNIIFMFEKFDGTMEIVKEELVQNPNSYGPILHFNLEPHTKRVHCFAPLTRSTEWRSVSIAADSAHGPRASASSSVSVVHRSPPRRRPHRKHSITKSFSVSH